MKKKKNMALYLLSQLILMFFAVIVLYPLFFVFMTSLKSSVDVISNPFGMKTFEPENFVEAWKIGKIGKFFMNSVIITIETLAVQMTVIFLISYSLGKLRPRGSRFFEVIFIFGLFVTSEMVTIPNFVFLKKMGLAGTRLSLLFPYVTSGIAMASYIMTNYIKALPKELDEAGLIDGAGLLKNIFYITLPLMKPIFATIVIFNFQGVWSEFYWALIEAKDEAIKTLPLGLMNFQSQYNTDYGVLAAGLTMSIVPILILYLVFSSQFIGGMTAGAVKG